MNCIKPGFIIESEIDGDKILKQIEKVARTCYKSEDRITSDSAAKFVGGLIKRGHEAMIEHSSITVRFICDRGVSHEIVRHRVASFGQESTRYCNYSNSKFGNEINVIDIEGGVKLDTKMKDLPPEIVSQIVEEWAQAMKDAEVHYIKMIELGATPQMARSVLPNSLKTEIVVTMNMREWRHFFKLRTDIAAHPQMRELTLPLLAEFKKLIPVMFDDI
ncbi:FAD-dependent thymidylate synthase [Clostridium oryzae]|uniref:FAD-dependent thymidylate synthase n=1 Tax=Clostridium oryzae TaxID=1450648 RepID=A0A1V4IX34_9CLOT|nr:FAD-dependent thymidylate synthase [Clostridium oryzae]OPJ64601.1 thymidylate synthase ThyX [Clostridium oryzae]